jgi:murein L,D-transpeptidase YcbB/YkuD
MPWKIFTIVFCISIIAYSCNGIIGKKQVVIRDTTITTVNSFNSIFFDSADVDAFLVLHPDLASYKEQFNQFYIPRNFEFAWFDSSGLSEQAHNFYNLQNNYINNFEDSSIYNALLNQLYDSLTAKKFLAEKNNKAVIQTELLLTGQFFKYAAKVYKGADINAAELGWFIPRKKINLSALLDTIIAAKAKDPDAYAPMSNQYKVLENWLIKTIELEKKETNDSIPWLNKPIKIGDSAGIVFQIKQRLNVLQSNIVLDSSNVYDTAMLRSVKLFQLRHGLAIDGVIGNQMIAELNIPLKKRVQQILVNLERIRWMPPQQERNFILVNIPAFRLHVMDSGKQVFDMRVIVGSAANNTVIFNGNLKYIVFSPYWNVPESIVRKEILPAMQRDRNYIGKHNMEITGYSGSLPIVRQKPGPTNSLGLVKFLFPNSYSIYLHDTPNRNLFQQSGRGLSHGCIRIAEPKKFAQYLLRDDTTTWKSATIDSAMHLAKEKWVTLKQTIPVYLVYFTAWVDKDGLLNFRKDIYGHDTKMMNKLFNQ